MNVNLVKCNAIYVHPFGHVVDSNLLEEFDLFNYRNYIGDLTAVTLDMVGQNYTLII